jgi:UDP-N-acetylenolpyruvoylglucosamine reductase
VITEVRFTAPAGDPEALEARMAEQLAKRDATQPTKDRTAGSTFRNPAGFSSTGRADDTHELKAWKVIDDAGMRGVSGAGRRCRRCIPTSLSTPVAQPPQTSKDWARRCEKGFSRPAE